MKKIKIWGESWSYEKLSPAKYDQVYGNDSQAITDIINKTIHFRSTSIDMATIIHELLHAYKSYLCLDSTNEISGDDWEEIYAELFAKYGTKILDNAKVLHKSLNRGK